MKSLELKDAKEPLYQYTKALKGNPLLLLISGKPVAALVSTDDLDWETLSLSQNPKFMRIIEKSRKSFKKKGGLSTEQMRRKTGSR